MNYIYAREFVSSLLSGRDTSFATSDSLSLRLGASNPDELESMLALYAFRLSHVNIVKFEGGDVDYIMVFVRSRN